MCCITGRRISGQVHQSSEPLPRSSELMLYVTGIRGLAEESHRPIILTCTGESLFSQRSSLLTAADVFRTLQTRHESHSTLSVFRKSTFRISTLVNPSSPSISPLPNHPSSFPISSSSVSQKVTSYQNRPSNTFTILNRSLRQILHGFVAIRTNVLFLTHSAQHLQLRKT